MSKNSRQALVGDIGGTHISLAITDIDELTVAHFALLSSADFDNPMDAIQRYLRSVPQCPDMVGLAIAGTVTPIGVEMTHRPWTITKKDVRAATGAEHVTLLNDFEALALSLPHLTDYDLITIGDGVPVPHATKVVIGDGTGLGVAGLVWSGQHWVTICGEGGRASFPAPRAGELEMRKAFPADEFVSTGKVFSGSGLVALYEALAQSKSAAPADLSAPQIVKVGLSGEDAIASEALKLMATWLGRFAGNIALLFGARGGVFLGGGLASNIVPAFNDGRFRTAFNGEGEQRSYLETVPVKVIKTGADAGLRGAAIAVAQSLPAEPVARPTLSAAS